MKTIIFILQKEFIQIFRNRTMLPIIFVMPIIQLLILVHAATFDMKNIQLYVVDHDLSSTSRGLVNTIHGSPFFKLSASSFSPDDARQKLRTDEIDIILHIPNNFERNLIRNNKADLQLIINAINGTKAGIIHAYTTSIIAGYNKKVMSDWFKITDTNLMEPIDITYSYWYNPEMNYKTYMVPGILVLLVTIIAMFLSAMNLVREKEIGTIEQINVTPIRKYQFITGKLLPFWVIALFELAFGLFIGKLLFDTPIEGSLLLLFAVAAVYLLVALGVGLFISTVTNTQQQAMFISWFFVIIFILMSGLFTSVDSMPLWAQKLNYINPLAYFMKAIRMILLKGAGAMQIWREWVALAVYAVIILGLATWRYRKIA